MEDLQHFRTTVVRDIDNVIGKVITSVEIGQTNPLEAFAVFKKLELLFNEAKRKVDAYALEEAEKYGQKSFELNGQKYELRDGSKKLDYSEIQEYQEAKAKLKEIEEKYKGVYQVSLSGQSVLDESTGEVLQVPTITFNKQSLIVKK